MPPTVAHVLCYMEYVIRLESANDSSVTVKIHVDETSGTTILNVYSGSLVFDPDNVAPKDTRGRKLSKLHPLTAPAFLRVGLLRRLPDGSFLTNVHSTTGLVQLALPPGSLVTEPQACRRILAHIIEREADVS